MHHINIRNIVSYISHSFSAEPPFCCIIACKLHTRYYIVQNSEITPLTILIYATQTLAQLLPIHKTTIKIPSNRSSAYVYIVQNLALLQFSTAKSSTSRKVLVLFQHSSALKSNRCSLQLCKNLVRSSKDTYSNLFPSILQGTFPNQHLNLLQIFFHYDLCHSHDPFSCCEDQPGVALKHYHVLEIGHFCNMKFNKQSVISHLKRK